MNFLIAETFKRRLGAASPSTPEKVRWEMEGEAVLSRAEF